VNEQTTRPLIGQCDHVPPDLRRNWFNAKMDRPTNKQTDRQGRKHYPRLTKRIVLRLDWRRPYILPFATPFAHPLNKNSSIAVGSGNGETRTSCLFARCHCDAARKAHRYCARCNSTRCNSTAAAAADGTAVTQCTD